MIESSLILGIETSCDDTAAAVVRGGVLAASVVSSQPEHGRFGGVVPEVASRSHQRSIVAVVDAALAEAGVEREDLDGIAVTYGPGLAGALLVGISFAKAFAVATGKPLIGINHLDGHILSPFLEEQTPEFPYLCLAVSGGHTRLVLVREPFDHEVLGRTRDDAAGEAFDKVGKLLGLDYPAGPRIDELAAGGDPSFVDFPRTHMPGFDFSFSGIKTAVLYHLNALGAEQREQLLEEHLSDLCASFQAAMVDMLAARLKKAIAETGVRNVAITGGVSANRGLRMAAEEMCTGLNVALFIPRPTFCTDNAAMIALAGYFRHRAGYESPLTLTASPRGTPAEVLES